jgi:DNA-directed RNA polymerase specialized sigma24 family protein
VIAQELNRSRTIKVKNPIKTQRLPWPRLSEDEPKVQLGVDVVAKQQDIIKIVYKFFRVEDISMDELLQEVYLAILHKNQTRSAHDQRKSSFGHYVYMVADNVCKNLVNKRKRRDREKESLDAPCNVDGSRRTNLEVIEDCGFLNVEPINNDIEPAQEFEEILRKNGKRELARYIRAVRYGARPEIIKEALSFGQKRYSAKMVRDLKTKVKEAAKEFSL